MYPNVSTKEINKEINLMMDIISYSDGTRSLLDIAELCEVPIWETYPILEKLIKNNLIKLYDEKINL